MRFLLIPKSGLVVCISMRSCVILCCCCSCRFLHKGRCVGDRSHFFVAYHQRPSSTSYVFSSTKSSLHQRSQSSIAEESRISIPIEWLRQEIYHLSDKSLCQKVSPLQLGVKGIYYVIQYSPSDAEVVKYESLRAVGFTCGMPPCPAGQSGSGRLQPELRGILSRMRWISSVDKPDVN